MWRERRERARRGGGRRKKLNGRSQQTYELGAKPKSTYQVDPKWDLWTASMIDPWPRQWVRIVLPNGPFFTLSDIRHVTQGH